MLNFITKKMGWPSELTRGAQIAEFLNCKINAPIESEDTVICIKSLLDHETAERVKKYCLDFIDDVNIEDICKAHRHAEIIVLTPALRDYLASKVENKIVVIPEHTCNFENLVRTRKEVSVVGYIGDPKCFLLSFDDVKDRLSKHGLEFKCFLFERNVSRRQVCDFYMNIDIQIAFRPDHPVRPPVFRNPLKIINAGSFKIPTVAFPEFAYRNDAKTIYLDAVDRNDLIKSCIALRDDSRLYEWYSLRSYEFSKNFTIDKIAQLYKELDK